jgi:TRAP-type C4-dicarboxylate transport system permease small subunit
MDEHTTAEPTRRWHRWPLRLASVIEGLLFAGLFGALITQVVARFVLDRPAAWTEEAAAILFLWVIFWGAAFTTPLSAHVAIDLVESRFGPRVQRVTEALGLLIVGGCFAWALPGIVDYVGFMDRETTPVTGIKLSWAYAVFVAFAIMVVLRCAWGLFRPPHHVPVPPEE